MSIRQTWLIVNFGLAFHRIDRCLFSADRTESHWFRLKQEIWLAQSINQRLLLLLLLLFLFTNFGICLHCAANLLKHVWNVKLKLKLRDSRKYHTHNVKRKLVSSFFLVLVRTRKSTFSAFYKRKETKYILVFTHIFGDTQKVAWQANDWIGLVNALLFEANVCFVEIVQNANSAHWTVSRIRFCVFATVAVLLEKGQRKIAAKICLSPGSRSWFVYFTRLPEIWVENDRASQTQRLLLRNDEYLLIDLNPKRKGYVFGMLLLLLEYSILSAILFLSKALWKFSNCFFLENISSLNAIAELDSDFPKWFTLTPESTSRTDKWKFICRCTSTKLLLSKIVSFKIQWFFCWKRLFKSKMRLKFGDGGFIFYLFIWLEFDGRLHPDATEKGIFD